jgi:large subunit ribosomal protein L22
MEAIAKLNNCPSSPRKMRLVVDIIRGVNVDKALNILKFSEKSASKPLEKLLLSALNNWVQNPANSGTGIDEADLYVKTVSVDSGRILKRFRPAPMGRAYRIRKRSNHVTLVVDSRNGLSLNQVVESAATEVNETKKSAKAKTDKTAKPSAKKSSSKKAKTV